MSTDEFVKYVDEHTLLGRDDFFTMNALAGELGELANVVKKFQFYQDMPLYQERINKEVAEGKTRTFRDQFVDEAGDTLFYFVQMLNKWGVTMEEVMQKQHDKIEGQFNIFNKVFKK